LIEQQTGYTFSYNPTLLNDFLPVTLKVKDELLKKVLEQLFDHHAQGSSLVYERERRGKGTSADARRGRGNRWYGGIVRPGRQRGRESLPGGWEPALPYPPPAGPLLHVQPGSSENDELL